MSHKTDLLDWFARVNTITPAEAFNDLGIYRLGARIHELRSEGHEIRTDLIDVGPRRGRPARYIYLGRCA